MDKNPVASLNFKHLHYFWMVARSGSIASASKHLHLTPQSISSQLSELEGRLGVALFRRVGRGLELTETGQRIFSYADEIFALGDELLEVALDQTVRKSLPFRVGIANSVPKSLAYRVVEPALRLAEPVRLLCREGRLAPLLAEMAVHHLDLVIADQPMPNHLNVRGYSHFLGESDLTVFAAPQLAQSLAGTFPASLNRAPFLLPGDDVALRPDLLHWFEAQRLYPHIVGEFEDSALLKAFGQAGAGLFVAPTAIADYVIRQYTVQAVGRIEAVTERLYAITTERRLLHPAIVAVVKATQREFFGKSG
ncbi:MAG: transcriptional activator NhaR [Candidatus Contendobacter sp.]